MKQHMTHEQFRDTVHSINAVVGGLDTGVVREALAFVLASNVYSIYSKLGCVATLRGIVTFISSSIGYYRYVVRRHEGG